jgi:putative ABC transport system substrate-binding protein
LKLTALRVVASSPAELAGAVDRLVRQGAQAVVVTSNAMFFVERARLQELLARTRLPVAHQFRDFIVAGGLLSYAADLEANFRYVAKFVDKILRGAKPADLPVEQPTKFQLVLNLKTAKALGLKIPQTVLLRVDELIE